MPVFVLKLPDREGGGGAGRVKQMCKTKFASLFDASGHVRNMQQETENQRHPFSVLRFLDSVMLTIFFLVFSSFYFSF